ncbi:Contactin-associated protein-like 2 [Exaiptasia diaphana]|nr:Contactin-associated protein-like 2 [Exaiptasia diaphana]
MTPHSILRLIFLTCSILHVLSSGYEVEFNGPQYISYDIRTNRISTDNTHISLQFKTFHPSGVLIYSSGTQGDFITLELIQGKLRFAIDLGSTSSIAGRHQVIMGNQLADNRWHTVKVDRSKTALVVSLDSEKRATTTPGSFVRLDLDKYIYVGGLDRNLESDFHGSRNTPNFIGCLKDVYFDYIDILYGAKYKLLFYATSTKKLSFSCPMDKYHPVGFPSPQSHLRLSDPSLNNLTFSLSFRSYTANGIIAFRMSNHARVYVGLVAGTLELEVRIGIDPPIKISVGGNLDDGKWHDLTSGADHKEIWILLDDKPEVRHSNPRLAGLGNFRNQVYIGSGTHRTGFIGCMHNIQVNGARILPKKMKSGLIGVDVDQCNARSVCYPNPCQNGGRCKQYRDQYSCDCAGTFYHGNYCEIPLYRATCADYKALGVSQDSYCTVDADGKGPLGAFEVLCNVTASKSAATIITHDKMQKQLVPEGARQYNRFYFHRITYHQADMASMRAVVQKSTHCRQYISFNCFKSRILNAPIGPAPAQWLSGSGTLHSYWGGAPRDKHMCSCGLTGTCDNPRKLCNCDIGDAEWREDSVGAAFP